MAVPQATSAVLPPEVGAAARRAEDALLQAEADARRAQDPSEAVIAAFRAGVGAIHMIGEAAAARIDRHQPPVTAEDFAKLADQLRQQMSEPLTGKQVDALSQRLARGCEAYSLRQHKEARWHLIGCLALAGAGVLALGVAIGFYLGRQPSQVAVAQMHCYSQPNGQTYCGYWQPQPSK